jgi:hypothetical protein
VVFPAQVCEALVGAGTELLQFLENKFTTLLDVRGVSGIKRLTAKMVAAFPVVDKRLNIRRQFSGQGDGAG